MSDEEADIARLTEAERREMATLVLGGWSFRFSLTWWWVGQHPDYFDQYGCGLSKLLEQIRMARPHRYVGYVNAR